MAITDFFRKSAKAIASADKVLNSDFKSSSALETQDVSSDANESVNQNSKNSVASKLNKEQSSQVDEIVEKLKKDLKSRSSKNQSLQEKLSSTEETKIVQNVQEVLLDEAIGNRQEISKQKIISEKSEQQDSVRETQLSQSGGLVFSDFNREDPKFKNAENSAFQLDEKQTRLEIEKELRSFNISDFHVNENDSFIDPSKYYKFLALRERAGGLGMASEFNKMEVAIEFIKYQELEKGIRRPSYEGYQDDRRFFDDGNKSTNFGINEDLRELLEGFTKLRDSLAAAISSGAIKIIQGVIDDIDEMVSQKDNKEKKSKKEEVTSYVIEDSAAPEAKEFVKNLENVVTKLEKIGLQTKIERDHETGAQYFETSLPSDYKGSLDIKEINLEDIANSVKRSVSGQENNSAAKDSQERLEEKTPKLRFVVGSLMAIKKLQEKQGIKSKSLEDLIGSIGDKTISEDKNKEDQITEKSKESAVRFAEEAAGRFTQMILKQRQIKQKDNQIGG
ncbi:MAG: hypothetical protein FJ368_05150 [Pelagibacterales bacterium]|nr:hypothetical protein [Pelagibacterales bacterium]